MENFSNVNNPETSKDIENVTIPKTYIGILEFINENRTQIANNFNLILKIFDTLDILLKKANDMGDLHKDTKIILETIKLQLDSFLKEYKNEISLSKFLLMAENNELDDFFENIKLNSQAMNFVDRLDFGYSEKKYTERTEKKKLDEITGFIEEPKSFETGLTEREEAGLNIQKIRSRVLNENEIEFFDLIFDENSFSLTIKNAFNLALTLRMKQVSIKMENSNLLIVPFDDVNQELNHSVFEMTPFQYETLKKKRKN